MPVAGLTDSDVPAAQGFRPVVDPYTGQSVVAIPAITPDVAIIHVHEADPTGNARIRGTLFEDVLMVTAARRVILTAERLVDGQSFAAQPELTTIAGFMVDMVVEAPIGAWPCSCAGLYDYDTEYLAEYVASTRTAEGFERFLALKVQGSKVAR
jgi:acyl CoA:acetate/3-ketoacid CoA transferase alpha subunit